MKPDQQYMVVSNHLSNLDSMVVLAGLRLPLRFLAMRELFDVPVLGAALRRLGMIEVNRDYPDSTMIGQGVSQAMADGASIMVFPEGQTSHDGTLNRFRIGAFSIAIGQAIPILPITLIGTREVWAPGSNTIHKGVVRVVIHQPLATHGLTQQDATALRERSRISIASAQNPRPCD